MHHWLLIIGEMAAPAVKTKAKGSLGQNVFQLRARYEGLAEEHDQGGVYWFCCLLA